MVENSIANQTISNDKWSVDNFTSNNVFMQNTCIKNHRTSDRLIWQCVISWQESLKWTTKSVQNLVRYLIKKRSQSSWNNTQKWNCIKSGNTEYTQTGASINFCPVWGLWCFHIPWNLIFLLTKLVTLNCYKNIPTTRRILDPILKEFHVNWIIILRMGSFHNHSKRLNTEIS